MKRNNNDFSFSLSNVFDEETEMFPLMSNEDEEQINKEETPNTLPILPLRNTVLFPGVIIPITIGRDRSINLIKECNLNKSKINSMIEKKFNDINKDEIKNKLLNERVDTTFSFPVPVKKTTLDTIYTIGLDNKEERTIDTLYINARGIKDFLVDSSFYGIFAEDTVRRSERSTDYLRKKYQHPYVQASGQRAASKLFDASGKLCCWKSLQIL